MNTDNTFDLTKISKTLLSFFENQEIRRIDQVFGGGNNRCYVVATENQQYFLKHYYKDSSDLRNRLNVEYKFASYIWELGIRSIPQPIGYDANNSMGVYEYIQGRKLESYEIGKNEINKALEFIGLLNKKNFDKLQNVPNASEACYSIADHIQVVDNRMEKLRNIPNEDDIDQAANDFINDELIPKWITIKNSIYFQAKNEIEKTLSLKERILSPSDFGFHNVLLDANNEIKFFDFEYAGWDDPAKLVCDFFSQPAVPVSINYFQDFAKTVANLTSDPAWAQHRMQLLFPLIRAKWCCIALNCFVPGFKARKIFSYPITNEYRLSQINKASIILSSI